MMTERVKMRYVSCPVCGKQLFKVSGNCSVEINCSRCRKNNKGRRQPALIHCTNLERHDDKQQQPVCKC